MKYMLLIYGNEQTWKSMDEIGMDHVMDVHQSLFEELTKTGEYLGSAGLTIADAKVVRVQNDVPAVTDGPFSEAKEVLAGYYLVDCESSERAAELAGRLVEAQYSPIEVRAVMDDPKD
ncbi:YciI family protein [Kribbella sp. NBC_01245]|uniref:YciI family protein n=1 Tax=Kribbella sp. NBC_01245 TaxID=2903578 RepID=UPI002E28C747|nr:YciI family protein [Kribbella sp. NBC_01245]